MLILTSGITSYIENGLPVAIDSGALFDNVGPFNSHSLAISLSNASADSRLGILKGNGTTGISIDGEAVTYNGVKIGTSHRTGLGVNAAQEASTFVITFDALNPAPAITAAIVQELIRSLTYSNSSEILPPTAVNTPSTQVTVQLKNGATIVAEAQKSIRIDGGNDAPTIGRYYQLYDASTNNNKRPNESGSAGTTTLVPSTGTWFSYQDSGAVPGGSGTAINTVANGTLTFTTDGPVAAGYSNYEVILPTPDQVLAGGATIKTSRLNNNTPILDRTQGYTFSFKGQVLTESRDAGTSDKNNDGKDDRAGFTVTLIGNDLQGIELQFWTDRIWARNDGLTQVNPSLQPEDSPQDNNRWLFTQSEYATISNNGGEHNYDVTVKNSSYTVYVDGVARLSGRLRDYTAAVNSPVTVNLPFFGPRTIGTPDFYEQPNLIFFGDKNPNAQASVEISTVSLTTNETFTTRGITEDGTIVLRDIAIGDAEAQLANVLVTLTGAVGSQIQIAATTGVTIGTNNSRSVTLTGAPNAINAALLAGISYIAPLNANGIQSLEIKVNDQGQGGGSPLETIKSILLGRTAIALAPIVFSPPGLNFTSTKTGAEANETIYASKRDDIINGGEGDDWIGGGGCDFLIQFSGRFLWDRDGNDQFNGGAGNDQLYGYGGNDDLKGGIGDDQLYGGRGNDILSGGDGLDTLVGSFGSDTFVFNSLNEGLDTILDFEVGTDLIDLRGIFADSAFSGTSPFARYQQFVTIAQVGNDSFINIDSDGSGSGTSLTTLTTLRNVTAINLTSESFIITTSAL